MSITKLALFFAGFGAAVSALLSGAALISGATWLYSDEIAYVSYRLINTDIYVTDVMRAMSFNLTHNPAYEADPAWSPDGEWIAFSSDRDGRRNIYVMDRFGGRVRRLTNDDGFYRQPRWSRDGRQLVFLGFNESPTGIYAIGLDGGGFQRLTDTSSPTIGITLDAGFDTSSISRALSPDGTRLAFMTYRDQAWGIYVSRNLTRDDARLLVNVGRFTEAPVWSPDGKHMAYIALSEGASDLFVIDVDGGTARRLTTNRSVDTSPAWRP